MGVEIERKFLVKDDQWRRFGPGVRYRQGYLTTEIERTVRVRVVGNKGFLTIKGKTRKSKRNEFEYEIPIKDARWMLDVLCKKPLIEKIRYTIKYKGLIWEIDEFLGVNEGLILAEVELSAEDQVINLPEWIGQEVTGDPAYYNANLVIKPYSQWQG